MFENLGVCVLHLKLTVTGKSNSDTDGICHVLEKQVDMGHVVKVNIPLPYGETISHMLLSHMERCVFVFFTFRASEECNERSAFGMSAFSSFTL